MTKILIDESTVRFVMEAIDYFFAAPDDEADQEAQEHLLSARSKLRQALEQPAPAQPWVGLTDEEVDHLYEMLPTNAEGMYHWRSAVKAVEAELKEKNTKGGE